MKQEEFITKKYGKDSGMQVPEDYFLSLRKNIMQALPEYPKEPAARSMSKWQRVKPYVYLAAMFCGIWLMMQLFHSISSPMSLSLDNPPEALVQLIEQDKEDYYDYMVSPSEPDYLVEDEFIASYDSIEDFEKDFNAQE